MRRFLLTVSACMAIAACEPSTIEVERLAIVYIGPSSGATGIGVDTDVRVTFSELLRAETVNAGSLCVARSEVATSDDCSGDVVPAQVSYDAELRTVVATPLLLLGTSQEYTIRITTQIEGESGILHSPVRSVFTTED